MFFLKLKTFKNKNAEDFACILLKLILAIFTRETTTNYPNNNLEIHSIF